MPVYFGVNLRESKYGLKMNRDNYAIINNRSSLASNKIYDNDWCIKHLERCLLNYDSNIHYFSSLDKKEFHNELDLFLNSHPQFKQIFDLNNYKNLAGYYMLVLDEYCQVYIGTAKDIKRRIMAHWSTQQEFDRLIFGDINNSILAMDSFKAYDTTRIYGYTALSTYAEENKYLNIFPSKFLLNRTSGGKHEFGLLESIANGKFRKLTE